MMKNSEWGAVAYLSHSEYGINEEIYVNNSSSYSGRSGGAVGGSVNTVAAQYPDNSTSTSQWYYYGYYTWLGQVINYDGTIGEIKNASFGTKASTTGNVTGIYDMSGGSPEYVMGNYYNRLGEDSGFSHLPPSKYYDSYEIAVSRECTLSMCGGHALHETESWYNDEYEFIYIVSPWFARGGGSAGSDVGIFSFYGGTGECDSESSRSVLVVSS